MENPTDITVAQIENLRKRLNLTRTMQGLGIASLFFCVVSMFLIYIGLQLLSAYIFGLALLLLIASLGVSLREIQISTRSLEIYLSTMERGTKNRLFLQSTLLHMKRECVNTPFRIIYQIYLQTIMSVVPAENR